MYRVPFSTPDCIRFGATPSSDEDEIQFERDPASKLKPRGGKTHKNPYRSAVADVGPLPPEIANRIQAFIQPLPDNDLHKVASIRYQRIVWQVDDEMWENQSYGPCFARCFLGLARHDLIKFDMREGRPWYRDHAFQRCRD